MKAQGHATKDLDIATILAGCALISVGVLIFVLPFDTTIKDFVAGNVSGIGVALIAAETNSAHDRFERAKEQSELTSQIKTLELQMETGQSKIDRMAVALDLIASKITIAEGSRSGPALAERQFLCRIKGRAAKYFLEPLHRILSRCIQSFHVEDSKAVFSRSTEHF